MKLVWVHDKETASAFLPSCRLAVETAVVRRGTPLFLPGWSSTWVGKVGIGVAIDRLGRHIDRKFSHRYYNRCVLVINAYPGDPILENDVYKDALFSMDGSILVSEPLDPVQVMKVCREMGFTVYENLKERLDIAISQASKAFTLHTGDVVVGCDCGDVDLVPDTRLTIMLDGEAILNHKIK